MLDYRFPTALQMVLSVAMAEQMGERSTSAILAYGLEANPSFIRKLMVPLTRDGIIVSTLGRNGAIHLGRPADKIPLRGQRQRLLVLQIGCRRSRAGFVKRPRSPYRGQRAGGGQKRRYQRLRPGAGNDRPL